MPDVTVPASITPPLPPPRWSLPDDPDLEWLRKRAKRLRTGVIERDPEALELLTAYDPPAADTISLARAQRVLARAFGFGDWAALRTHLAVVATYSRRFDAPVDARQTDADRLLRLGCLDYTDDRSNHVSDAKVLLAGRPELATASVATMALCGAKDGLAAALAADPGAANRETGPFRWPPLLYLTYGRLDVGDPVRSTEVLLAHGADADAGFLWHGLVSPFTALTGAFGGGEQGQPAHPHGPAIAQLLLRAGADPNDNQTLYNRMFTPADDHLELLFAHGLGTDRPSPWRRRFGHTYPSPQQMLGEQLRWAAGHGLTARVRLLLDHGVDARSPGYHADHDDHTAFELAVAHGHLEAADLLAEVGGASDRIDDVDRLLSAALAADRAGIERLREASPALVEQARGRRPDAVAVAVEHGHDAAIPVLLDLGFDVNAGGRWATTALHEAAHSGRADVVATLLAAGADPTRRDERFDATPADWAAHAGHHALADDMRR
ncbi:MAG TPA: ankyrin repeat domain-containing protein [Mycobacterium sp.]|nr:ankyrin repeat domain-containing protein [Mycobacterium sp.]